MSKEFLEGLLPSVLAMAREAGKIILDIYHSDFDVSIKSDNSPVTEADEAAEKVILAALSKLTPNIPVVAEESVAAGKIPDISNGLFWLVDPLDGTKEFVSRNGQFTVNIALIQNQKPILGVVYAPVMDEIYYASGAGTAYMETKDGKYPITTKEPSPDGIIVLASKHHCNADDLKEFLNDYNVISIINAGSSLKFCRLAKGEADIYLRLGHTSEWDTAAGHAVLIGAGGHIKTIDGKNFLYKKKNFKNPYFIALGR